MVFHESSNLDMLYKISYHDNLNKIMQFYGNQENF